jgi:MutL C terminal dimerisation domain
MVQVSSKVIVAKAGNIILAIDQHAADERVQLERLQERLCGHMQPLNDRAASAHAPCRDPIILSTAPLPEPVPVQLTWHQHAAAAQHQVGVLAVVL